MNKNKNHIQQEIHYSANVWTNTCTDKLRKTECLCFNCKAIKECPISKELYYICKNNDLALMMTRCKNFESEEVI